MFTLLQAQVADTLAVSGDEVIISDECLRRTLGQLFLEGGWGYMLVITVLLAALLFFAWKFPKLVKVTGLAALAFSVFATVIGVYQIAGFVGSYPEGTFSDVVIGSGVRVALIPVLYGLIVYMVSLVLRAVGKFRK